MRAFALLLLLACGAPTAAELDSSTSPVAAAADAGVEVPVARCYCCWPASGRCRFTRANSAPADACESDPAQRCVVPDAGGAQP